MSILGKTTEKIEDARTIHDLFQYDPFTQLSINTSKPKAKPKSWWLTLPFHRVWAHPSLGKELKRMTEGWHAYLLDDAWCPIRPATRIGISWRRDGQNLAEILNKICRKGLNVE